MNHILRLMHLMEILRDPENGCPWDIKQTFSSITSYTIEEVYEVVDAIDRDDFEQLKDELGDLLFQIVYYSQIAREQNLFEFDDVAKNICDKLVRRHPYVFDSDATSNNKNTWESIKNTERESKQKNEVHSVLDDIPKYLPQLLRAVKIQKRASSVGFDWNTLSGVIKKIEEELDELKEAFLSDQQISIEEELGDFLFSIVNLSRHLNVNPEDALRKSNNKFIARFNYIEDKMKQSNKNIEDCTPEELDEYWNNAKEKL